LLLIVAVLTAGCTSPDTGTPVQVTPPAEKGTSAITTPSLLPSQTSLQTRDAATATQTAVLATPPDNPVSLTIFSATKQTKLYTTTPKTGRIFLVLNITIKNNGLEKGYDLTDNAISLSYAKAGTSPVSSITSQVRGGLKNPIIMPTTIERYDQRTGQVVFGVVDSPGRFTLNLIGTDGTVVSSAIVVVP
jgi:hypothetical protein